MRVAPKIMLNEEKRMKLMQPARARTASVCLARRARIVLPAATGKHNNAIVQALESGACKRQ